jgi:vitamin B12 transporter
VDNSFTARGVEVTTDFSILKQLKFKGNATYTKVDDKLNLRIPEFKVNASLLYDLSESTFMSLTYQFNDGRTDSVYNPATYQNDDINLKSYHLFDFYISHKLIKNKLMLFANVTNILNEDYQELYGYSTCGRNVSLGLNINL